MQFQKSQFQYHGGYLTYGPDRKFVARFKRTRVGGPKKDDYIRLLTKYYTQENYFERLKNDAPMQILLEDGFIDLNVEKRQILVTK